MGKYRLVQWGPNPTWDPEAAQGKASERSVAQTSMQVTFVLIHSAPARVVLFLLTLDKYCVSQLCVSNKTAWLPGEQAGSNQIN